MTSPKDPKQQVTQNTDRELYREDTGEISSYYENSLHVTAQGTIGMNVGGYVITLPIAEWHKLATDVGHGVPTPPISSSRLGDECSKHEYMWENDSGIVLLCKYCNEPMTVVHSAREAAEAEALRGITEQSEVAEGNGTAATPNPDSEGELEVVLEKWFDMHATLEPDNTRTLVLHEVFGWPDWALPDLRALIHRREQEKYDEGLADGLGGKLYKQINITEEVNIPQELRRNIEAEYAIKVAQDALSLWSADETKQYLIDFIEQHRTKQ